MKKNSLKICLKIRKLTTNSKTAGMKNSRKLRKKNFKVVKIREVQDTVGGKDRAKRD